MTPKCRDLISQAIQGIIQLPDPFEQLVIQDTPLNISDWDAVNTAICAKLKEVLNCPIVQGMLDPFYNERKTWGDLLAFVAQVCGCL